MHQTLHSNFQIKCNKCNVIFFPKQNVINAMYFFPQNSKVKENRDEKETLKYTNNSR